jgi:hypothetical protein
MNRNKKYILFREDVSLYILQKDFPHSIGKLTKKKEEEKLQCVIPGYHLYVTFQGTLRGNQIPLDRFFVQETSEVLPNMANFLLENLIYTTDEYEKYKIRNSNKQYNS